MSYITYRKMKHGYTCFSDNRQNMIKNIRFAFLKENKYTKRVLSGRKNFEQVLVLLKGSLEVISEQGQRYKIGPRADLFKDKAWALYIPVDEKVTITSQSGYEAALCSVYADTKNKFQIITPSDVKEKIVGKNGYERKVFDIVPPEFNAQRIILGETLNPQGNWSSFPPHKHDEFKDDQIKLEEIYYFRTNPDNGFGFQRIYSPKKGIDEALVIKNHSVALIPEGYHPVSACPGYEIYYLWVLAGDVRALKPYEDPEHSWITQKV